tara:strand:- start:3879 stop:4133 length:255 start_codon:yes stop_codon:yes gene_type:complete
MQILDKKSINPVDILMVAAVIFIVYMMFCITFNNRHEVYEHFENDDSGLDQQFEQFEQLRYTEGINSHTHKMSEEEIKFFNIDI